jgi:hypothetical protein
MAAPKRSYEAVALFVMVVAEIPNFYSGFLPSLFTIATFSGDREKAEHTKRWIRRGEIQATGLSFALGIAASLLIAEAWPFLGTMAMSGYLVSQYEHALRKGTASGPHVDMTDAGTTSS